MAVCSIMLCIAAHTSATRGQLKGLQTREHTVTRITANLLRGCHVTETIEERET